MSTRERASSLCANYQEEVARLLPSGAELFDAHVHIGQDIDGFEAPLQRLLSLLEQYRARGAFGFCLDEPDRHPGFRAPNDRVLAAAREAGGRLLPFVRLDLAEDPLGEATRCLDLGARGVKLHPRAQRFLLDDERLAPIFALAEERRVPILIHGGRGLPPIAKELASLVERYPGSRLIVAHAGIADLAALSTLFCDNPHVFFDTSVWSAIDLLDLYSRVAPEQVLYASDYPYGQQPNSLLLCLRTAHASGVSDEQLRGILGGSALAIAGDLRSAAPAGPVGRGTIELPLSLARINHYLTMASALVWTRQQDGIGVLGLAINACHERDGYAELRERIHELLACARDLWLDVEEAAVEPSDGVSRDRLVFGLIQLAATVAVTPDA